VTDPYSGREQTKAKHFIIKNYLQALAFKILTIMDLTYVDGFSGPWETKTPDFRDTSFMIAISVLQDAQKKIFESTGKRRGIRCFFAEQDPAAFAKLEQAVVQFHKPDEGFEIKTYCGKFEDAVADIQSFTRQSFALIFIDPTGWTGYALPKIKPLFMRRMGEVLINFMYDFINRFAYSADQEIIDSFAPILGGPDWTDRLDPNLPRGLAVEKLFRDTLKSTGNFNFVISTKIDRASAERPHFFIAYGTKSRDGLIAFRQIEWEALRERAKDRARSKEEKREQQTGIEDLFAGYETKLHEATIGEIVNDQKVLASEELITTLSNGALPFSTVVESLLQAYMLRETNIKDICLDLAKAGQIENTWGGGNRKPHDNDMIKLKAKH
jgi:three-Cys-motif partner protein